MFVCIYYMYVYVRMCVMNKNRNMHAFFRFSVCLQGKFDPVAFVHVCLYVYIVSYMHISYMHIQSCRVCVCMFVCICCIIHACVG
jgi:hypothetical protein